MVVVAEKRVVASYCHGEKTARTVTMHQPNYLPWIGLFSKISKADCFIINDTAQYTSGGMTNRNRIRTNNSWCYLTIPVRRSFGTARILDIPLPENRKWQEDHWKSIWLNYVKTRFFKDYADFFQQLYQEKFEYLWQLNEKIILFLLEAFQIKVEVLKASQMEVDPHLKSTDLIIACLKGARRCICRGRQAGITWRLRSSPTTG
ncbi:MAG: WbqC family protein [Chloroflexi bacterium]|nr:WbqC family protein [Chloroflexota bacterium]